MAAREPCWPGTSPRSGPSSAPTCRPPGPPGRGPTSRLPTATSSNTTRASVSVILRPDLTSASLLAEAGRRPRPQDGPGPARCKSSGCCRWEHPVLPGTSRNQSESRPPEASGERRTEVLWKTSNDQFVTFL